MIEWIKQLFTEVDNQTPDLGKVLIAGLAAAGVGAQLWSVAQGHEFRAQDFFLGAGGFLAGGGALLHWKKESGVPFVAPPPDVQVNVDKKMTIIFWSSFVGFIVSALSTCWVFLQIAAYDLNDSSTAVRTPDWYETFLLPSLGILCVICLLTLLYCSGHWIWYRRHA